MAICKRCGHQHNCVKDFEQAREMYEPSEEWTERDERIWQEYCEMRNEQDIDFEAFSRMTPTVWYVDEETWDWLQKMLEEE